ncbi:MAG: LPS assembly protein LptD [Pseudomonadota bacterium]
MGCSFLSPLRWVCVALVLAVAALAARAQEQASLVADSLRIDSDSVLVAEGAVTILYKGRLLKASRVTYDQRADRLMIAGPIVLTDGAGTLILASQADLAADLSDGILQSARVVLNQQLQMAASRVMRIDGRYTDLGNAVASSCRVCGGNPVPLWEIRARRIVHDQVERQIYFDGAQMRLAGVPVFYLPRLRMPDPTLDRATGFLIPTVRTTSQLGIGLKLPYFIKIGDSADLTLTPYVSTKQAQTVELRYRQAFRTGSIEAVGAVSNDQIVAGGRGYARVTGDFTLPGAFSLGFQFEETTDDAYLLDYGISDKDKLESNLVITRTRRNEYILGKLSRFDTLRDDENPETIPSLIADMTFQRRFGLGVFGGTGGFRFQTHSHTRTSQSPLDGPDPDSIADGRDMTRISAAADWRKSWVLPLGIEGTVAGEITADAYQVDQDAAFAGQSTRLSGTVATELRWPLVRTTARGGTQVLEPVVQFLWSPRNDKRIPNEDSTLVEFDEGNLFSLDRFPGSDATESGTRLNTGITWTTFGPGGWSLGVTGGRVWRQADTGQFGPSSGLGGVNSDWLGAMQLATADGLLVTGRVLFDDSFEATKSEVRLDLARDRYAVSGSYLWAVADVSEDRPVPTSELVLDAAYKLTPTWTSKLSGRYDFQSQRGTVAGMGLAFRSECLLVDLSLSRRFTSSTSVKPTTSFDLSFDLLGFGGKEAAGPARTCRR